MQPSFWAADTGTYASASPLQPSRLPPCTPHRRRTAGAMSPCYRAMTAGEEAAPPARRGILGAARWLLAPPSDEGGTSPPRPKENEAATLGVRHRCVSTPLAYARTSRPRRTRHSINRRAPDGSTQAANAARIRSTRPRRARCDTSRLLANRENASRPPQCTSRRSDAP